MMAVDARVVRRRPARGADAADEPELIQQVERVIDGRRRQAGALVRQLGVDLLGRDVPGLCAQVPVDEQPGHRDPAPGGAQRGDQLDVGIHKAALIGVARYSESVQITC
jgi:hypothetical protein